MTPLPSPAPVPVMPPVQESLPLPPLVKIECPKCRGQGYIEHCEPMPHGTRCPECFGQETIEVCSGCGEIPGVVDGLDCCGCCVGVMA